jgi:hypothetical protein
MLAVMSADSAFIADAAAALSSGDTAAFLAAFDPSMPELARLRSYVSDPTTPVEVLSIEFPRETAEGGARTLEMNWRVRIVQEAGLPATTVRSGHVTCRLVSEGGKTRIRSLEPLAVLAPPDVDGAWSVLQSAISAWIQGGVPDFDPAMPGLERLRADVRTLLAMGELRAYIDLIDNQGDDANRTIEGTWTIEVLHAITDIQVFERTGRVVCQVARRKKQWRIVGIEPVTFFDPPTMGK